MSRIGLIGLYGARHLFPLPNVNNCLEGIDGNIIADCVDMPFAGLEANVRLINRNDIDYAATTFNADKTVCTSLVLKATKEAFTIVGFKKSNDAGFKLIKKDMTNDGFEHELKGVAFNRKPDTLDQINKLCKGNKIVAIVEYKHKGSTNTEAYMIYGINSGLELQEATHTANANNGTISLRLASTKDEEEPNVPCIFLDTDYATTKAAFEDL